MSAPRCSTLARTPPTAELDRLVALFGKDSVVVELTDHAYPDDEINDALARLANRFGLLTVATGNVHYHSPGRHRLAQALAAVRARRSLDEMDGWLAAGGTAYLRSGEEMAARMAAYPGAVARAAALGVELAFDLDLIAPRLPACEVGEGHTEMSWLRHLTEQGAVARYGTRSANPDAYRQLVHELDTIDKLGFPGYFLIVHDIVEFCRTNCGRSSNSPGLRSRNSPGAGPWADVTSRSWWTGGRRARGACSAGSWGRS